MAKLVLDAVMYTAAVFLVFLLFVIFEMKNDCERFNNVYTCKMLYVPAEPETK